MDVLSSAVQTAAGTRSSLIIIMFWRQTADRIRVLFFLPGGADGGSGRGRRHPGEAAGAEASGPTVGRTQRRHQVSPTDNRVSAFSLAGVSISHLAHQIKRHNSGQLTPSLSRLTETLCFILFLFFLNVSNKLNLKAQTYTRKDIILKII